MSIVLIAVSIKVGHYLSVGTVSIVLTSILAYLVTHSFLKTVNLLNGKKKLYPFKAYCYAGLQNMLQKLILRPGFVELSEQWRSRVNITDNKISDIMMHKSGKIFNILKENLS